MLSGHIPSGIEPVARVAVGYLELALQIHRGFARDVQLEQLGGDPLRGFRDEFAAELLPPRFFVDYLTLLKTNDGWRIVAKAFKTETK